MQIPKEIADYAAIVLQLIFLEGILSLDNAAVLGAMVSHLPEYEPIPWPGPLRGLHLRGERLLGGQRQAALKVGLLGAYLGRGLMLFLATIVIRNPWLKLLGAAYLVKLAAAHLGDLSLPAGKEGEKKPAKASKGFWSVVLAVELADLVFSLDNVVAAVAISDKLWVVLLGVAIGILLMRFAAGVFAWLVVREPVLIHAAYILILNIGVELILEEASLIEIHEMGKFVVSLATILLALAYEHIPIMHVLDPLLRAISTLLRYLNRGVDGVFRPLLKIARMTVSTS